MIDSYKKMMQESLMTQNYDSMNHVTMSSMRITKIAQIDQAISANTFKIAKIA